MPFWRREEAPGLKVVQLPEALAVGAEYGMTVMNGASEGAAKLSRFILSPPGQEHTREARIRAARHPMRFGNRRISIMKLSARNILQGKVTDVKRGATTSHVKIQIAGGAIVTASITNEAVDDLQLKAGDPAYAVIKASDVMVAKD